MPWPCREQDGLLEFVHGGFGKPTDLDVADVVVHHVRGINAVDGDFVPNDVKDNRPRSPSLDAHLNHGSFGAFEQLHDIAVGDANARCIFAINFDNAVACANAQVLRRGRH